MTETDLSAVSREARGLSDALRQSSDLMKRLTERVGRIETRLTLDAERFGRMEAALLRLEASREQEREQLDAIDAEAEAAAETASQTSARQNRDAETARLQIEALDGRLVALDGRLAGLTERLDKGVRVTLSPALAAAIVTTLGAVLAAAVSQIAPIIHALRGRP